MALDLTPEQQEIFDRVVGIVTQNDALRQQFKSAIEELHKQPDWEDYNYRTDSDDPAAVNARAANAAVMAEVSKADPHLKSRDSWLFGKVCMTVCHKFIDLQGEA